MKKKPKHVHRWKIRGWEYNPRHGHSIAAVCQCTKRMWPQTIERILNAHEKAKAKKGKK